MSENKISAELIASFLEGRDPQRYITNIEVPYHMAKADLIINDPERGKYIESKSFKPFLWMKGEVSSIIYDGDRKKIKENAKKYGVKFKTLRTTDEFGNEPPRLKDGYKFLAQTNQNYSSLITFFRQGGVDLYSEQHRHLFMSITPVEQFMIQTGKRLFKGMEDYDDIHRFQFDLETEGLNPKTAPIFQIGMRDNRGFEEIIEVKGDTPSERRESERTAIKNFFKVIDILKPDVITGYNSENFDWNYFDVRCEKLGMSLANIVRVLDNEKGKFARRASRIKLGGMTENYDQTYMWGYSILDIWHAVRKAKAINSEIKLTSLKYITKFSKIAKPNRVYVPGDILHSTWADEKGKYYYNDTNGDWFKFVDPTDPKNIGTVQEVYNNQSTKIATGQYTEVSGAYVVRRYLLDDLWETEKVDGIYNQATFLVSKILPTSFMKAATMGTAGTWKLIMMAWSYENGLAIPALEPKRAFTGGLSRLNEVGYAKRVAKLDYAALYPNIELTHDIFPDIDISGVMKGLLYYIVDQRDTYKFLKGDHGKIAKDYKKELALDPENKELQEKVRENEYLASNYDKKQLPLKILANSFFGSFGASYLFNWGDVDCAEETTCRGRQYLRLMVKHFHEKYGFRPLVGDTDGYNFAIPDSVDEIEYTVKGTHRLTEENKGKTLKGLDAVVADFNEEYMIGRMGLDIDDVCESTINFSRKNYGNKIDGKVKLVGNTIKSSKLPGYIEEFLNEGIRLLLDDKGKEFVELYYKKVDEIFNYQIPLAKMASKSKVNQTMEEYAKYCEGTNKAGNLNSRKAFMELLKAHDIKPNMGDIVYYVNTGEAKSHGDLKTIKDENGKITDVELNCKLIPTEQLEKNPNLTTDEYNVPKYLAALNKRIKPLLVCFGKEVRDKLVIDTKKNRKTKEFELTERHYFTNEQCKLISGEPFNASDQDTYEELMTLDDKEIRFWDSVGKVPNNMEESEWIKIRDDWKERMVQERLDNIEHEKKIVSDYFSKMSMNDFELIFSKNLISPEILKYVSLERVDDKDGNMVDIGLVSHKFGERLFFLAEMLAYEPIACLREEFYTTLEKKMKPEEKLDAWELHVEGILFDKGEDHFQDMIDEMYKEIRPKQFDKYQELIQYKVRQKEISEIFEMAHENTDMLADLYNEGEDIVEIAKEMNLKENYEKMMEAEMKGEVVLDDDEDDEWNF
jgi:DNA polymerase elongation subunit (family B)